MKRLAIAVALVSLAATATWALEPAWPHTTFKLRVLEVQRDGETVALSGTGTLQSGIRHLEDGGRSLERFGDFEGLDVADGGIQRFTVEAAQ